ncbi:ADP-ribosylation factor 1 [Pelomyxa schiedti]|nr:ADP-ribosylation factor 1 [Pelomyxa schiedti]
MDTRTVVVVVVTITRAIAHNYAAGAWSEALTGSTAPIDAGSSSNYGCDYYAAGDGGDLRDASSGTSSSSDGTETNYNEDQGVVLPQCYKLQPYQYTCEPYEWNPHSRSAAKCDKNGTVPVTCHAVEGVKCLGDTTFTITQPCLWTTGYTYEVALGLSLFLGIFGIDRCYLGYPTLGVIKFLTFGGFLVMYVYDIISIATQILHPSDGSNFEFSTTSLPRLSHKKEIIKMNAMELRAGGSEADKQPARALMLGLDESGKTALLYRQKLGEVITTIPTIGFNVERIPHKNREFTIWDVGGQDKIRPLWHHYFSGTQVLIWVVDAHDRERMIESRVELHRAVADEILRNALVLILANKQDLPDGMNKDELADMLEMHRLGNRKWTIQPTSAISGTGITEGLDWAYSNL